MAVSNNNQVLTTYNPYNTWDSSWGYQPNISYYGTFIPIKRFCETMRINEEEAMRLALKDYENYKHELFNKLYDKMAPGLIGYMRENCGVTFTFQEEIARDDDGYVMYLVATAGFLSPQETRQYIKADQWPAQTDATWYTKTSTTAYFK